MSNKIQLLRLLLIPLLALACRFLTPTPTATMTPPPLTLPPPTITLPLPTVTPPNTPTEATPEECSVTANGQLTLYNRPSSSTYVFAVMEVGFTQTLEVRTAGGWLGFDPGVAQAANIGSFCYRWVNPASDIQLNGACDSLPEVWAQPPGVCFSMPMEEMKVHTSPDGASPVLVILKVGDFAAMTGKTATGWAMVDLAPGNTGNSGVGWVEETSLNSNGPFENLPVVTP
jgi:hypothetical protein